MICRRQPLLIAIASVLGSAIFSTISSSQERGPDLLPVQIAIPEFHGSMRDRTLAQNMTSCIRERLQSKLALQVVEVSHLAGESPHIVPDFDRLEAQKIRFLIVGSATFLKASVFASRSRPDTNHIEFRFVDVAERKQIVGGQYYEPAADWQQTCQTIVDEIQGHLAHGKLSDTEVMKTK